MEKYIVGLQLMIVGMGTVLLALFLLSIVMNISKRLLAPDKSEPDTDRSSEKEENELPVKTEFKREKGAISPRQVAAVSAVINHLQQEQGSNDYRIISITRNRLEREGR